jgi:molybdopterin molybdotransferase
MNGTRRSITPAEALTLVIETAEPLGPQTVAVAAACGLMLAEAVATDRDYPPFPRSMMDGFAVRVADAGQTLPIAGLVPAGTVWKGELPVGQCLEILTGAPCPAGAEAVVAKEDVVRQAEQVALPGEIRLGRNIAPQGSECRAGQVVMLPGDIVTPMAVGVMASFSRAAVRVIPRPSLGIICTGAELAAAEDPLEAGQIRDSNGPMLAAMTRGQNIEPRQTLHVADRLEAIRAALQVAADWDIVVLAGGVSVGTFDLVPQALAGYGAETVFHGVMQKPGKPLLFARKRRQLLFGLPGNPLACHLGFHRYISAGIAKLSGRAPRRAEMQGELVDVPQVGRGRTHFLLGQAEYAADPAPRFRVRVLPSVSSADIFHGCQANCYVELQTEGESPAADNRCTFTWLGDR